MATVEVVRTGFLMGERVPKPKKSPSGFEWPAPRLADAATKEKFQAKLTEELRERGMTHRDLAVLAHGEVRGRNGHVVPRTPGQARKWVMGESFPSATAAAGLAGYFKISMADLLKPKGPLQPMELLRPGTKGNGKGNGHDHAAAAPKQAYKRKANRDVKVPDEGPSPPVPLPEGASSPSVKLESYPGDARFMAVVISGVLPVDRALALVAMIHPEHR